MSSLREEIRRFVAEELRPHARDWEDALVKQGAIDKGSIGYRVRRERRANDGVNGLLDIELHEVSLVLSPAKSLPVCSPSKMRPRQPYPPNPRCGSRPRRLG